MKAVRFTKSEADAIREVDTLLRSMPCDTPRGWGGVMRKLDAAEAPSTNVDVGPIERALIAGAQGKVVALDRTGYGRASVQAGKLGVTPDDARLVGEYLRRTKWLTGPFTLLDVLNKWPSYIAKARATQPPPSAPAGFGDSDAEAGPGPAKAGTGTPAGRRTPGFR